MFWLQQEGPLEARQNGKASQMFHIKDTLCKTFAMLGEAKLFKNELEAKETGDIQDPLCLEDPSRSVVVFK